MMRLILPALLFLSSIHAFGHEYASGDWKVISEEEDAFLGVPSCRAFTGKSSAQSSLQFSISFPKDYIKAPVAILSLSEELQGERVELRLKEAAELALPLNMTSGSELSPYWYVPVNMDHMIDRVINAHHLELAVYKDGVENLIKISLAGSFRTLQSTLTCLNQKELYLSDFFSELNDPEVKPLVVNGAITPARLNDLFNMTYSFFIRKDELAEELVDLRSQNEDSLKNEKRVEENYTQSQLELKQAEKDLVVQERETESDKREKVKKEEEIIQLDGSLKIIDEEKSRLYITLAPIQMKLDEIQLETNTALLAFDSVTGRLKGSLDSLAAYEAKLEAQTNSFNQLSQTETKLSSETLNLQTQHAQHIETLNNYNVDREIGNLIQQNQRVAAAQAESTALKEKMAPLELQVDNAKIVQIEAQRDFESCRRSGASSTAGDFCNTQISALQKAQSEFSYLQSELRYLNSQISNLEREVNDIKQSIRNSILAEWNRLDGIVKGVAELIAKNENSLRLIQIKKSDLLTSQIPQTEKEIVALKEAIRRYEGEKSSAETLLTTLTLRKEDFVRESGVEVLLTELSTLKKTEKEQQSKRNQVAMALEALNLKIEADTESHKVLSVQIEKLSADFQAAKEEYEGVRTSMKEFRQREAQLQSALELVIDQYAQGRSHYQYIYAQLIGPEVLIP